MLAFFAFIVAMFISLVLVPPLMRSASRLHVMDLPSDRKVHSAPIPRVGGLAMIAGSVTPILLWVPHSREVLGLLFGIGVLLVFGLWDDRKQLDYRMKFAGQLFAVSIAVLYGGIRIHYVPMIGADPIPEWAAVALSIFALLGVTNAINLADGLDGLAAGTTLLSIGVICLLAFLAGNAMLPIIGMAVMGAIVGFLRFNTHPAQVFMGDAGSQFLGFVAGVLVIILTQQVSPVLSPAMPLLLLGLPLIDTFLVMGQRVLEKRSPFKPDRNHIHHKLLSLGLDHYAAVVVIYLIQGGLVTLAFVYRYSSDFLNILLFGVALVILGGVFALARRHALRLRHPGYEVMPSAVTRLARGLKRRAILTRGPMLFAAFSLTAFGVCVAVFLPSVPADGYAMSFVLWGGALVMLGLRRRWRDIVILERLVMYLTITALIFYWCAARPTSAALTKIENLYFIALGASLLVAYRFGRSREFEVTPTDVLIILIAVLVPTFASRVLPQPYVVEVGVKALVTFYALELILLTAEHNRWWVRPVMAVLLSIISLRALLGGLSVVG